ncbi:hypothetical protein YPPY36_1987, partial [Yersinia pestis PY-36]
MAPPP